MSLRAHLLFWGSILGLLIFFMMSLSNILLPFVAGMAIAYLLDPVADWMEHRGIHRVVATSIIMVGFVIFAIGGVLLLVPMIEAQIAKIGEIAPAYGAQIKEALDGLTDGAFSSWLSGEAGEKKGGAGGEIIASLTGLVQGFIKNIVNQGLAFFNVLSLIFITPVVAFYLLVDWDRMVSEIDRWLPRDQRDTIVELVQEIDHRLAGFVRGTTLVCTILALFYATALELAGLDFGFIVGLIAGALSFVPYLGFAVGAILSAVLAILQFWPDFMQIGIIAAIFLVGQIAEGNVLTPNFVGRNVELHPVWVIFALLAFGSLFGFVGILMAVPLAAMIGVLMRYAVRRYLASPFYHGNSGAAADE